MNQTTTKLHIPRTQKELIQGILQNNEEVLKLLYIEVYPKVRGYIFQNNGNEAQAQDIFQEAFIACWKNIKADKLSENGNVEAYLYTIAKNKWVDYLRSNQYKKTISNDEVIKLQSNLEDDNTEIKEKERETNSSAMQAAFKKLGNECRMVLKGFYYERKSMQTLSKELNIGTASVRNKKYRCMERLRILSLEIRNNG